MYIKDFASFIPSSKQESKAKLLRILRERGPIPRQKIAKIMHLTPATITNLTGELLSEGKIEEVGINEGEKGKKGPKSINLDISDSFFWVVSIHIRYGVIELASVNFNGEVRNLNMIYYSNDLSQKDFMNLLSENINQYIEKQNGYNFSAITIASFGLVDSEQGNILKVRYFPTWKDMEIRKELESVFHLPVLVMYHVQAMALAVKRIKKRDISEDFLVVYVGEGIGSSLYLNGELLTRGGQLAHMNYQINGKNCWCGQRGCIEQYVSETKILKELSIPSVNELQSTNLYKENYASKLLYSYGEKLGIIIASFLQMVPMKQVVLVGSLFFNDSQMVTGINDKVIEATKHNQDTPVIIKNPNMNNNMGVIGAAGLAAQSLVLEKQL